MPKFSTPDYAPLPPDVDFFYPKEVAAYLRCSLQTVYNLIEDGALKAHWLRGCYRIRRADLQAYFLATFDDPILTTGTNQQPLPFSSK
ncbi:MAG: helix-turn-helix domain-containing protein [Candidatus Binatia bacterium]